MVVVVVGRSDAAVNSQILVAMVEMINCGPYHTWASRMTFFITLFLCNSLYIDCEYAHKKVRCSSTYDIMSYIEALLLQCTIIPTSGRGYSEMTH